MFSTPGWRSPGRGPHRTEAHAIRSEGDYLTIAASIPWPRLEPRIEPGGVMAFQGSSMPSRRLGLAATVSIGDCLNHCWSV